MSKPSGVLPPDPLAPQAPVAPRLPDSLEVAAAPDPDSLRDTTWSGVRAVGWNLPGAIVSGVELSTIRLEHADLSGAQCSRLIVADCEVTGNLANVVARDSSLIRVVVHGARLTGLSWPAGILADVRFENCQADLSSFRFSRLQRVTFRGCALADADFQGVQGTSVALLDCDLRRAVFSQVQFERTEIRRCRLEGIPGVEGLRGVGLLLEDIVSLAGAFATALGVRTLDR